MHISQIKTALITGATSEIALRMGEILASYGVHLILTSKSKETLLEDATILRNKTKVTTHIGDLIDPQCRQEIIELMQQHQPELLINNAGIGLYGPALCHSTPEQLAILDINARALLELTLEMARQLKQRHQRGIILNIASAASYFVFPTFSVYSASKAFVRDFSLAFDDEVKKDGIRVLCACPGQIETGFRVKAAKNYPQKPAKQAMSPAKAAKRLIKQIESEKKLTIFDWRYRLGIFLSRLLPRSLVKNILVGSIRNRYRVLNACDRDI